MIWMGLNGISWTQKGHWYNDIWIHMISYDIIWWYVIEWMAMGLNITSRKGGDSFSRLSWDDDALGYHAQANISVLEVSEKNGATPKKWWVFVRENPSLNDLNGWELEKNPMETFQYRLWHLSVVLQSKRMGHGHGFQSYEKISCPPQKIAVSKHGGTPKSCFFLGFSMTQTIHFGDFPYGNLQTMLNSWCFCRQNNLFPHVRFDVGSVRILTTTNSAMSTPALRNKPQ